MGEDFVDRAKFVQPTWMPSQKPRQDELGALVALKTFFDFLVT